MKTLAAALIASASLVVATPHALAETFAVDVRMNGELPFFGMTANELARIVREELVRKGHAVVEDASGNVPVIKVDYGAWSSRMDGGQTLLGKAEGVILVFRPYEVVVGSAKDKKGLVSPKTQSMYLSPAYRVCNGIATDDRRSVLQEGFRRCVASFVAN